MKTAEFRVPSSDKNTALLNNVVKWFGKILVFLREKTYYSTVLLVLFNKFAKPSSANWFCTHKVKRAAPSLHQYSFWPHHLDFQLNHKTFCINEEHFNSSDCMWMIILCWSQRYLIYCNDNLISQSISLRNKDNGKKLAHIEFPSSKTNTHLIYLPS